MPEDPAVFRPPSPDTTASPDAAPGRPRPAGALFAGGLALACWVTAACGVPPELQRSHPDNRPSPTATATPTPTATPSPTPSPSPSPSALVSCAGSPSQAQVTALLRRSANLPRNARVTFKTGPLCAADWQYSVVEVPDRETLQAVTRGPASALRLVTAGSDVCTIPVRIEAPTPIRTVACEAPSSTIGGL